MRGGSGIGARALVALALTVAATALAATTAGPGGAAPGSSARPQAARVGDGRGGVAKRKLGDFAEPTYVTHAPGRPRFLYVVERAGRVRVVRHGHKRGRPFLQIAGRVSTTGERGLLSIAFDPRFRHDHLFYAYYTNDSGNIEVDRFRASSPTHANRGSRRRVIVIPHPDAANHNGGTIRFGPNGDLYIGTGDGGGSGDPHEHAQSKHSLLGKLLRIDPRSGRHRRYRTPRGNPFVGKPGRNEIYAMGLRNPFRFSFDRSRILIGDVGQDHFEEVDLATRRGLRGANFGWDHFEGDHRFDYPGDNEAPRPRHRYRPPIFEYSHSGPNCESFGGCAITGGEVVRDRHLRSLRGRYLYADFFAGKLRSFVPHRGHAGRDRGLGVRVEHPTSFGVGANGTVYVTSLNGPVYRLVPK